MNSPGSRLNALQQQQQHQFWQQQQQQNQQQHHRFRPAHAGPRINTSHGGLGSRSRRLHDRHARGLIPANAPDRLNSEELERGPPPRPVNPVTYNLHYWRERRRRPVVDAAAAGLIALNQPQELYDNGFQTPYAQLNDPYVQMPNTQFNNPYDQDRESDAAEGEEQAAEERPEEDMRKEADEVGDVRQGGEMQGREQSVEEDTATDGEGAKAREEDAESERGKARKGQMEEEDGDDEEESEGEETGSEDEEESDDDDGYVRVPWDMPADDVLAVIRRLCAEKGKFFLIGQLEGVKLWITSDVVPDKHFFVTALKDCGVTLSVFYERAATQKAWTGKHKNIIINTASGKDLRTFGEWAGSNAAF